ncbi:MAG: PhzF family phenazine biosynthesis protein [Rhodothermales bacterium]
MPVPMYQVDAFTDTAFRGNPAAVCLLDRAASAEWMQHVAAEMNLSETAFLVPRADGFDLRWFTPTVEVDLCGHATLASAHVLWETGRLSPEATARFHTRSGLLTATRSGDLITLDFPATAPQPADAPDGLAAALGVEPVHIARSRFDYLVEVGGEAAVRSLAPDFRALGAIDVVRGIIVTARGSNGIDFVSRFFAPAAGVDEDPATGSAHCCLAPYWVDKLGRNPLAAFQASARGGTLRVEVRGDRVLLSGHAITVLRGELLADPA